ncbi:ABC-2 type transport system ATP-binding protein [Deinococcus budaensis]|uniref:ABC-2 type transport system ATP-binding protein n=1 Tax=Deinococcus budaensis TaxID=1665626 RepID=A0A7W8GFM2_9DEIO|nr:ABC transporter ATP-binding protein [Deinococcus budaensis]MBB5234690.1 ABC-2 type transport system ATP-binding protein [Deinococcus budaensis]
MTTAAVELRRATKRFGPVQALGEVSLRVEPGEVVAVLGPNGAGKTTAISLLLGLRKPSSGTARVFGLDPRLPASRARIGAMLQDPDTPGPLRVRELIELFRRLYPRALPAREVLGLARLQDKADAYPAQLSGGQRQRLSFALAICGDPEVLFLDEPSTGLDVEARHALWEQVARLAEAGKTVVLTTHNLEEADALAGRVVVLSRGRIVADGTPAEIKARVGGKHVRFRLAGAIPALLAALPGVDRVDVAGEAVNLYTRQAEDLLRALLGTDWPVRDIEVTGAGLEEAFVEITRERSPA